MPGLVAPIADEREGLVAYLAQQRGVARACSSDKARATIRNASTVSTLSIGGLIKHVAFVESGRIDTMLGRTGARRGDDFEASQDDYASNFVLDPDDTLAGALDVYATVATETEAAVAGIDDLGRAGPVPKDVPWYPDDADIVRESIDGATMYPLMAAVEGWPASPWMQPWEPAAG